MKCCLVAVKINVDDEVCVLIIVKCYNVDVSMINDIRSKRKS